MASGINAKLSNNLFRSQHPKTAIYVGMAKIKFNDEARLNQEGRLCWPAAIRLRADETDTLRKRREIIEGLIKEKASEFKQSPLAQKIKVAKGFYQLEMSPPKLNEMQKLQEDIILLKEFIQAGCFKYITVKQAWLIFLVGLEISLWFFLGETIGKMHLVGYKV